MRPHEHPLFEAILARISFGTVPIDGSYWFDPKGSASHSTVNPEESAPVTVKPVGARHEHRSR